MFVQYTGEGGGGYNEYSGDIMSTLRGYHEKCVGRSLGKQLNLYGNPSVLMISPTLIMVSPSVLNTPAVLMISSHTDHGISPLYSWYPPTVLNIHGVLSDTPSVLSNPSVLNDIPQCTENPRCTVQTLENLRC